MQSNEVDQKMKFPILTPVFPPTPFEMEGRWLLVSTQTSVRTLLKVCLQHGALRHMPTSQLLWEAEAEISKVEVQPGQLDDLARPCFKI